MMQVFLYVHVIWSTKGREQLLVRPIRFVFYAQLKKLAEEKGVKLLEVNGGADHIHLLLQLHPAQNLSQVMRILRVDSVDWLNGTQLLKGEFEWSDEMIAYSVSPGSLKPVADFIKNQEEYHQTRTFETEIEVFMKGSK
jgi:putative transposase